MYNRYIPQPDGSYRRNRMEDKPQNPRQVQMPQKQPEPIPPSDPPVRNEPIRHGSAFDFIRQLLPKNLDTGDLLIIVLLLLMAGDCKEEKNTALLTLALYFFL